jgi:aminoglycoside phosphotransferase family enzyme
MFVRWKHKMITKNAHWYQTTRKGEKTHQAYLVESKRIDGKPRLKVIAYLGSIRDSEIDAIMHRFYFRRNARALISQHCKDEGQRQRAEEKLAELVEEPDESEALKTGEELKQRREAFWGKA